jgi:hypothetical protein
MGGITQVLALLGCYAFTFAHMLRNNPEELDLMYTAAEAWNLSCNDQLQKWRTRKEPPRVQ